MTKQELIDEVLANILTGGRRTTAARTRSVFFDLIDSLVVAPSYPFQFPTSGPNVDDVLKFNGTNYVWSPGGGSGGGFLALDGSNSPTNDIDWDYNSILNLFSLEGDGMALSMEDGEFFDDDMDIFFSANLRRLYNKAGTNVFDFDTNIKLGTSLDVGSNKITSGTRAIDLVNSELEASNGNPTVLWQSCQLLLDNGQSSVHWADRELFGTWTSDGLFRLKSSLQLLDTTYKTALSVASASVLGFGVVGSEFTSFQFGDIVGRNGIRLNGAVSGNPVIIEALGVDTNIGIDIDSKGNSNIRLRTGGANRITVGQTVTTVSNILTCSSNLNANGTFAINAGLRITNSIATIPTNGGSTTVSNNITTVYINPASVIASHTYNLASDAVLSDGTTTSFTCSVNGITSLTINPGAGSSISGALTSITAGEGATYRYHKATTTWHRI